MTKLNTKILPNQTVFGYLVGTHLTQRPGKLITEYPDGNRWIKEYELVEVSDSGEKPWYLETEAGKFLVVTIYANREAIEASAPEGFRVVWKTEPPKKRGRKPKKTVEPRPSMQAPEELEEEMEIVEIEEL